MMRFNVVIVTFNRLALLKECLNAVLSQTYDVNKVFVVDNCSTDGTEEFLKTSTDKRVTVFRTSDNIGGAGGFAEGVRICEESGDYDYVMLIDDDAILASDCIEKIADAIKAKPNYPAYSTVVQTKGQIGADHRQKFVPKLLARLANITEQEYANAYFECDVASFCGMVVNGDIVKSIGLPIADYFIWFDDVEYSVRIGKYGKILNVNNAFLNHKTYLLSPKLSMGWKSYYGYRNLIDITRRHMGLIATIYQILRITAYAMRFMMTGERVCGRNAFQLCGDAIFDGLKGRLGINKKYLPGT